MIERNFLEDNFNTDNVEILVGGKKVTPENYKIELLYQISLSKSYEIKLYGIEGNGKLEIRVPAGTIKDIAGNINEETIIDPKVVIDNIAPAVTYTQEEIEDGKVLAKFEANEAIRPVNAWKINETKILTKEFANNVTYPFYITDYAQNITKTEVNVTKATNIIINTVGRSHYAPDDWGKENNQIIGKGIINKNPLYKMEIIFFRATGNVEKDFIGMRTYIHTGWGEGESAISYSTETKYYHGYNPVNANYAIMDNPWLFVMGKGAPWIMLGGNGVNEPGSNSLTGKILPEEYRGQYLFGISGLSFKLKDESYYSIIYQVWVNGYGWQKVASDGEEALYSHDKPFGCYRVSLIPKTEKQYLVDEWSKDVGTNNMK